MGKSKIKKFSLKLNVIVLLCIDFLVLLALIPYAVNGYIGFMYGWILGCGVEMICLLTIYYSTFSVLIDPDKTKGVALTILFSVVRLGLIVGMLIVSAMYTFLFGWPNLLYFWTTVGGILPLPVVLGITTLIINREKGAEK